MGTDRRASVSLIVAITATALMLCVGLAVDATRLWLVRTKLQEAVDAAALLAAMETGSSSQVADAQKLFWVNFSNTSFNAAAGAGNVGFLGATSSGATVTPVDSTHVQVTAQASLALTFMRVANNGTVSVAAGNAVAQSTGTYEIALALDITGSMLSSADSSGTTKIQAVKNAVSSMLSIMYGNADTVPNLAFSVVPFRGSVNIGTANRGWVDNTAYAAADWSAQSWRGCVEARKGGYDTTEDPPSTKAFNPLFWPTTYHVKSSRTCYWYGSCSTTYNPGDNDWYSGNVTDTGNGVSQTSSWSGLPVGPNLGCSTAAVLPLTASKTTISTMVSNMVAASGGSTVLGQGLQWAWFTLSPLWQSNWGLAAAQDGSARPLAYSTRNLSKVIILMTDGNNEWDGNEQTGQNKNCSSYSNLWPECVQTDGYYNSYGRLSDNRLNMVMPGGVPPTSSNMASAYAATALDTLTLQICSAIKAKGITIYTIAFQAAAGSDAETVLKGCATDTAHYYNTNTGTDISNAFSSIGQQLHSTRLTQ